MDQQRWIFWDRLQLKWLAQPNALRVPIRPDARTGGIPSTESALRCFPLGGVEIACLPTFSWTTERVLP